MNHSRAAASLSQMIATGVLLVLCLSGLYCYLEMPRTPQITTLGNGNTLHRPVDFQGRTHGTEKHFFPNGVLAAEVVYIHGDQVSYKNYWESGRLRMEGYEGVNYQWVTKGHLDQP